MTDSIDQLGDRISELAAHISAATCTLLDLIREFDEREGWGYDGANSCAHWLGWRCGMDRGAARERVRVAHAIATLPNIHGAFASGQVSYSKVRALNARDNGCRFPGCRHTRHLHAHHIRHWADGGETSLANLVSVCHFHHRKLHEGGFGVVHVADGALRFTRPDGGELPDVPAPHALHAQPDAALAARNYACGHAIDAHTSDCLWDGERLDMSMAIEGLLQDDGKLEVRVSAETRWDTVRPVAGVQRQP